MPSEWAAFDLDVRRATWGAREWVACFGVSQCGRGMAQVLGRGLWVVLFAGVGVAETLRDEVFVDGAVEELVFDRCASELTLVGIAHAFVHRSGSTLGVAGGSGGAAQLAVEHMRRLQAEAGGSECVDVPLGDGELAPVWTWADARALAASGRLKLNFGGGVANDFHAFDDRYEGWIAVEGPSDADGYDYGFCVDPRVENCGKPWCLCADLAAEGARFPLPDASDAGPRRGRFNVSSIFEC